MKTVQVAIQNSRYAETLRELLSQDVRRRIHLSTTPDLSLEGVIMVDLANLHAQPRLIQEQARLIVIVDKKRDDLSEIWEAGVRHVVFYGDPSHFTSGMVLGRELTLNAPM
jgi:hypothetical protein